MWSKIGNALIHFLHYVTGWIVHPKKGCYYIESSEKKEDK